jgi:hypothetical protein
VGSMLGAPIRRMAVPIHGRDGRAWSVLSGRPVDDISAVEDGWRPWSSSEIDSWMRWSSASTLWSTDLATSTDLLPLCWGLVCGLLLVTPVSGSWLPSREYLML